MRSSDWSSGVCSSDLTCATCRVRDCYDHAAGYSYPDPTIQGFSHTHFSGAGHSDLGDILVMPQAGEVRLDPGDPAKPGSGYRQRFDHATEKAHPGYYTVTLADIGIRDEPTARSAEESRDGNEGVSTCEDRGAQD